LIHYPILEGQESEAMNRRTGWLLLLVSAVGLIAPVRTTRAEEPPPPGVPLFDKFEGDELESWWSVLIEGAGSVHLSPDRAYRGHQSLSLAAAGPGTDVRILLRGTEAIYATVGVVLYDGAEIGSGNTAGLYVSNTLTGNYFGIVTPSSGDGNYQIDLPSGPLDTGHARTPGWHLFAISTWHDELSAGILDLDEQGDPSVVYAGDAQAFNAAALQMTAPPSGSAGAAYFDNYYLAWEYVVPEPGTVALLFAGALVAIAATKCTRKGPKQGRS
jgi:hypothetical protein